MADSPSAQRPFDAIPDGDPVISFRDVHKSFGDKHILRGISLDFPRGRTTVVIGPSGTGKSVCMKLIVGLLVPEKGDVWVGGTNVPDAPEKDLMSVRRRIGMMFQDGALFDSMSVGDNIAFPLRRHTKLREAEIHDAVDHALEQVGLPGIADRAPSALSGGMRKRVSLARAIITKPEIVMFDEPNSGLDPLTSDEIDSLISRMKEELGITFIVISHDIVGTFAVADKIAMLYNGHLVASGSPDEILHSEEPILRRFLARNMDLPALPGAKP
ncbi:MAG: ABC transporter ATP-binding protein [Deltaproteobacteria bacterium]|nr:ABC transporter ATP-binding protein [Deltaproteobacteria bacterium]